jgi:ATP-dependent Lon protease
LVGDREPRAHEFSIQLRAFDASKSGSALGMPVLLALSSALLQKSLKGGLVVVGALNLGGSVEPIYNAVQIAELSVEKGAAMLLAPVGCRKQMVDLSDDMAAKINILYYTDGRDALLKALAD